MSDERARNEPKQGISKVKLALGAASLFLFIVGVKRTFRSDDEPASRDSADGSTPGPRA